MKGCHGFEVGMGQPDRRRDRGWAGIGAAVALELGALGVPVTVATLKPGEGGEEIVDRISRKGGRAQLVFSGCWAGSTGAPSK
jgi:hypothetical protein